MINWGIFIVGFFLLLVLYPFYYAIYHRKLSAQVKWNEEDTWIEIEFGKEKYPIRKRELSTWEAMNRYERRDYVTALKGHLKKGRLIIVEVGPKKEKRIKATPKGRHLEFSALEFYKTRKDDSSV